MASGVAGLPDDNDNNDMYPNRGDCHGSSPIAQKVAALDAGADDYLTKPFGAAELLARVRVSLAPCSHGPGERRAERFFRGALESRFIAPQGLDPRPGSPSVPDRVSPAVGARQARRQDAHRQLLHDVWGSARADQGHYLRIYMRQLRHKLEEEPARPHFLLTEVGVGYRLAAE